MKNTVSHRKCVSIVILRPGAADEKEILLVHKARKNDAWQIPQGGIEEGETVEEAARRELEEETGIVLGDIPVKLCKEFYQYDFPEGFKRAEKPKYEGQHLAFVLAEIPKDTEVTVDQRELDNYRWTKKNEIGNFLKRKKYLDTVMAVLNEV